MASAPQQSVETLADRVHVQDAPSPEARFV
jgi:hypothetical protein